MGILPASKSDTKSSGTPSKRTSLQTDFAKIPPLKSGGSIGFSAFRDPSSMSPPVSHSKGGTNRALIADDSDDDAKDHDAIDEALADNKTNGDDLGLLSPEDAARQGELAEGVRKIKVNIRSLVQRSSWSLYQTNPSNS